MYILCITFLLCSAIAFFKNCICLFYFTQLTTDILSHRGISLYFILQPASSFHINNVCCCHIRLPTHTIIFYFSLIVGSFVFWAPVTLSCFGDLLFVPHLMLLDLSAPSALLLSARICDSLNYSCVGIDWECICSLARQGSTSNKVINTCS